MDEPYDEPYLSFKELENDINKITAHSQNKDAARVILYSLVVAWLKYRNNDVKCFREYEVNGKKIIEWIKESTKESLFIDSFENFEIKRIFNVVPTRVDGAIESAYANRLIKKSPINDGSFVDHTLVTSNAVDSIKNTVNKNAEESAKYAIKSAELALKLYGEQNKEDFKDFMSKQIISGCNKTQVYSDKEIVINCLAVAFICTNLYGPVVNNSIGDGWHQSSKDVPLSHLDSNRRPGCDDIQSVYKNGSNSVILEHEDDCH